MKLRKDLKPRLKSVRPNHRDVASQLERDPLHSALSRKDMLRFGLARECFYSVVTHIERRATCPSCSEISRPEARWT